MIEIVERIEVPASPEAVWVVLADPYAVVECIPGAELTGEADDGSFEGKLGVKFGPTRIGFRGRVRVELDEANRRGTVSGRGKDSVGGTRVEAKARFSVVPDGAGSVIDMTSTVDVTGRLATFIEGGARLVAKQLSAEFAQRLARRVAPAT